MISKAAFPLFRENSGNKELMFIRAKGKLFFVLPGGKKGEGELIAEALRRELQEELGSTAKDIKKLGTVSGQTPDGRDTGMDLFTGGLSGNPRPLPEIEEIAWMSKGMVAEKISLMTTMALDRVIPLLAEQGIW